MSDETEAILPLKRGADGKLRLATPAPDPPFLRSAAQIEVRLLQRPRRSRSRFEQVSALLALALVAGGGIAAAHGDWGECVWCVVGFIGIVLAWPERE